MCGANVATVAYFFVVDSDSTLGSKNKIRCTLPLILDL